MVPLVARLTVLISTLLLILLVLPVQLCLAVAVLTPPALLHHSKVLPTSVEVYLP